MAESPDLRKYLEAAFVLGQVTKARAEEVLQEMAGASELQREQIEQWLDELIDRGHQAATGLLTLVRHQVDALLDTRPARPFEDVVRQAGEFLGTHRGGTLEDVVRQAGEFLGTHRGGSLEDRVRQAGDLLTRAADAARSATGDAVRRPSPEAATPGEATAEPPGDPDTAAPEGPVGPPTGTGN